MVDITKVLADHALWLAGKGGTRADLAGADLSVTRLRHADARLRRANLSGADLTGANLTRANLSGADLTDARLRRADLTDARLRHADLAGANLTGANLSGADLTDARLRRADLTDARLRHADLAGADLTGADLTCARGIVDAGSRSDGYRFIGVITEAGVIIKAGCRYFSPEDAREHWGATRPGTQIGRESIALVFHIERMARLIREGGDNA